MAEPVFVLEPLPPEDAIRYFRDKLPMSPGEFYELAEIIRTRAFTVSGVAGLDAIYDIYRELQRALETGITLAEFRANVNEIFARKGWRGLTPYRADNVFRTNVMTALNVGRYEQMTDPDVIAARPYWQYDAIDDSRTRPTHRALDGQVRRADDPFWDMWYPPNGFRCRCGVRSLSAAQVRREGREVMEGTPAWVQAPGAFMPQPLVPDPGFATNPAKTPWGPDLDKYPASLRRAFEEREKRGI